MQHLCIRLNSLDDTAAWNFRKQTWERNRITDWTTSWNFTL